jgi:hypothetical protein
MTTLERIENHIFYSPDGCWYWTGAVLGVMKRARFAYKGRNAIVARVVYELHKGPIAKGLFVCHSCDNALCVNPDHLWLGTKMDNVMDMISKKRNAYGLRQPQSKLNPESIRKIRILIKQGVYQNEIAKMYNVTPCTIGAIKFRRTWKEVQ